jgi:hypothetical protein
MAEDNEAGLDGARERLAAEDLAVAALLAAGDPAAELAVRALAINRGTWRGRLWGSRGRCWTASALFPAGCFGAPERGVMPGRRSGRAKPA